MKFIIDRFEESFAIVELENKEMISIPRKILPLDAKEGDIVNVWVDEIETNDRRKRVQNKFNSLFSE